MKINIDEIAQRTAEQIERVHPWDLELTIGGRDYATKPLEMAQMGELLRLTGSKRASPDDLCKAVAGLFKEPPSVTEIQAMGDDRLVAILTSIVVYAESRMGKKSAAAAGLVRAAIAGQATPDHA